MSRKKHEYLEDYEVGQQGETFTRTASTADITLFACITGDYSSVHLDRHLTAGGQYRGRIAHGLLGSSLVMGMVSIDAPHIVGRDVPESWLGGFETNYRGAIYLDDTIKIRWQIAGKADDPIQQGFGLVRTAFQVLNQDGNNVYEGTLITKVRKRSAENARLQWKTATPWRIREFVPDLEKVYYLEDFVPDEGGLSTGRTFTEADTINFCGLTGDYNPLYVDAEFAKRTVFGQRIVHPMMPFTSAFGWWTRDGGPLRVRSPAAATEAGHLSDSANFLGPVYIGDTLRCCFKVAETRVSKSKPDRGVLSFGFQLINQRDEVVQEGKTLLMRGARGGA